MNYIERYRPLVADWDEFLAAVQRPLPTTIWVNPLKTTPEQLATLLPVPMQPMPWQANAFRLPADFQPGLHWTYLAGLFHLQEEVSMLPVMLLDPQPGERILDLCAAPGNKTAQIGAAMRNEGLVIANDRDISRMRAARQNLDRLGLLNITTTTYDGSNFSKHAGTFDRILVDAPCSCEGTCRKDPSALQKASLNGSLKMAGPQKALLRKAVQLCRPGGRIVYATCTFAPEENELVIDAILREAGPDALRLLPAHIPGFATSPGITEWQGDSLREELRPALRIWPQQNDTGGFFIAVLEKGTAVSPTTPSDNTAPLDIEREPWLTILCERYGFTPAQFSSYHLFRWSRKRLYLVQQHHLPPNKLNADTIGLHFMNVDGKYPKLTTAAAMIFGHLATRNTIDLEPEQVANYVARHDFKISATQASHCTGTGYIILRYQGFTMGVGVYRAHAGLVESLYPKGWIRENIYT
ncbi:MAG: NOL1/NOP2/sun family putative RNA methylase [Anaerolineales bacterium]|nr:NOL1/NOP2/sun family putative RNA methylase [Anaerolineales bacterium]